MITLAIMRIKEIRALSMPELEDKLSELESELMLELGAIASGVAPKNPGKIKEMKKTIARIKTIMRKKEKEV